jgi:prevent-host-death family protein
MKQIKSSDAKARFSELLDEVERGETIAITRHGKIIADIAPHAEGRRQLVREAIEGIRELRKHTKPVTAEEIIAWKNEGRK